MTVADARPDHLQPSKAWTNIQKPRYPKESKMAYTNKKVLTKSSRIERTLTNLCVEGPLCFL